MTAIEKKRKNGPTNESFARSRKPADNEDRPSKRLRPEEKDGKTAPKISHVPKITKVREEEIAFPRGGASVLTPLEHKQIQIEATRDVLFEQQGGKSKPDTEGEDGGVVRKAKKTKTKKGKKEIGETEPTEDSIAIEGLSYKRIVPGSLVLGQVSQINAHDVALSLPNNLTGYVPITSISEKISQKIEALAAAEDNEQEDEETEDIDLKKMFSVGQYLRAYVVSTSDDQESTLGAKSKRRIELSLRPQQSNNELSQQNAIVNSTLMASVISVEDHGLIMDVGLRESDMRGFMSSKEIGRGVDISTVQEGTVFFCMVTGQSLNGKIIKLSADTDKIANFKKLNYLSVAPTVDAFLPGTAVEILVADVTPRGIMGKVMGMVDVTADLTHSGAGSGKGLEQKYKIGSKIKGRIICNFPTADPPKLGFSLLDHVLTLSPQHATKDGKKQKPSEVLPLSTIVEDVTVRKVEPGMGLFVNVGVKGVSGFVHISRVKDGKIETLSETAGPYKVDSIHRGRVIGYNSVDGMYILSLEPSVLEQPFLRIEDLEIAQVVKGKVEKIVVNAAGVGGVLINLAEGISGLVPESHLADVQLLHPEKKFKEGMTVTTRVLSTDPGRNQIRLTLKKSLVNSEAAPFMSYGDISIGMQSPGTIVNILPTGAVVQFYGTIRGFLPVAEMSEAYIQDPNQHFKVGQVVNVHVLKVDPEAKKLVVSCKDPSVFGLAQHTALKNLKVGEIVSAQVTEKSNDDISVVISGIELSAKIPVGHLTDGSEAKNLSAMKKIRVGQTLTDLAVLEKLESKHLVVLTNKPSLVKAATGRTLLRDFDDVKENKVVVGFVRNVTPTAVFVQFGGDVTGLLPKSKISEKALLLPDFGLTKFKSIEVKVISVDHGQRRFLLSMTDVASKEALKPSKASTSEDQTTTNAVDDTIVSLDDFTLGRLTKARVVSVKETQINVQLADNVQGRIDVSQVFDSWDDIKDRKRPLKSFSPKQIVDVRILGIHDARNHRFLPISHRSGGNLVFELSAKPSDQVDTPREPLTMDKVNVGSTWIAYINNVDVNCIWVNLSPNVRGRIEALDVSDDVSLLKNLESNFPVGSAIKAQVKSVDVTANRLDLSARSSQTSQVLTWNNLSKGAVLPGKVTKVGERNIMVQLNDQISAPVYLTDLADDYSEANPAKYSKHEIVRVCITDVDTSNKKIRLSTRASRVLNSSLPVQDPEIHSASQLQVNDIVRGFVHNMSDKGIFVNLGGNLKALVRISDLSDQYVKDWKSEFQADQLVKGKVTSVDPNLNHVQLSLKASVIDKNYVKPLTFEDIRIGQIVTGKIRKVEDFGVFIVIDASANVSGLCHQSEMAEKRVHDVKKLYEEGDTVKAIVLRLEPDKRRISFGLKASYFEDEGASGEDSDEEMDGVEGVKLGTSSDEEVKDDEEGGIDIDDVESIESTPEQGTHEFDEEMEDIGDDTPVAALNAGGFDWTANVFDNVDGSSNADDDTADEKPQKKKKRKSEIKIDRTGDLDVNGPQSVGDFERLLLGQPDSSSLWIQYMAFQMQLSELFKAREVAERAIKTINIREETEKMNVWIALLNLEVAYGNDDTVDEVFKRACQYNDAQEIHEKLASIYIQSGKHDKADELFQNIVKKFSQAPLTWSNFAHFLHTTLSSPDRARELLPRAMQSLPVYTHLALTLKFAALEFHSPNGSPERGRTMFEGLLSTFPKRLDIWNQLLDLEIQQGGKDIIRGVFERVVKVKGLKPKGAKAWFRRWSEWEEKNGGAKEQEKVKAKAAEWVKTASSKE
ncbi:U3 small nucleolar RNA-associated rrp5 [Hyphodiscus hymeniophilus]|uniref:rRNA biogenesis protein RRP5 n=1 Tax=Hyphodiscus hymeniophilus TaxID=353542 RepID=A0A9P6VIW4_9HELO|nr:U3 small nucleolar RNA-associated rrp5 [Hyphodiscus hymeniophilus]